MSRWSMELAKYNYTIHNKQRKNNYVSDTLNKSIAAVDIENIDEWGFRELQRNDPQWKTIIEYHEGGDLPKRKLSAHI